MMGSHRLTHKQKLYEESAAVPLIVAPPAAQAGVDAQHFVSGLDILPTVLDYGGITAPASLEGLEPRPSGGREERSLAGIRRRGMPGVRRRTHDSHGPPQIYRVRDR